MTKMGKRLISVILVLSMVLGSASCIFATEEKTPLKYVAVGDSFSNGYGFKDFENFQWYNGDDRLSYGQLFADYLSNTYEVNYNKSFLINGSRSTDLYYLISDPSEVTFRNDNYINNFLKGAVNSSNPNSVVQGYYRNEMKDADIVSIKLGYNNYSNALFTILGADLGINSSDALNFGTSFSAILTDSELELANKLETEIKEVINEYLDPALVAECKAKFGSVFGLTIGSHTLGDYISYTAYSVAAGLRDFDNALEEIFKLSEDAQVYVLQLGNPFEGYNLTYTLANNRTVTIPFGDIAGDCFDIFNLYYALESMYSRNVIFIADDEAPQTMVDKIATDSAFASDYLGKIIKDGGLQISGNKSIEIANMQKYAAVKNYSINSIIQGLTKLAAVGSITELIAGKDFSLGDLLNKEHIASYLKEYDEDNDAIKLLMIFYLLGLSNGGDGIHPTYDDHERVAALLIAAYEKYNGLELSVNNLQAAIDGGIQVPATLSGSLQASDTKVTKALNTATAKSNNTINYLSLGDSNSMPYGLTSFDITVGGETYNIEGYKVDTSSTLKNSNGQSLSEASKTSWMGQFATQLAQTEGKTVKWDNLAIAGSRTEELHMFLDYADDNVTGNKYLGDGYTKSWFTGWILQDIAKVYNYGTEDSAILSAVSAEYIEKVSNADIITIELGDNNYGAALIYELTEGLAEGGDALRLQNLLDTLGSNIDLDGLKTQFFNLLEASLGEKFDRSTSTTIDKLLDYMVYSYLSFAYNFDYDIQRIYSLNPDVEIYVTSHNNTIAEWDMNISGLTVGFGDILSAFYEMMDVYVGSLSQYSDKYHYVDFNSKDPEGLWESVLSDTKDVYDQNFIKLLLEDQYGITISELDNVDAVYDRLADAIEGSNYVFNASMFEERTDEMTSQIRTYLITGSAENISLVQTEIVSDLVLSYDIGAGLHCSKAGHDAKAEAMMEAYERVQSTGVTAREYCIFKALGLYEIKNNIEAAAENVQNASNAILSSTQEIRDKVINSDASSYQQMYADWDELNKKCNESLEALSTISPLKSVLADVLTQAKTGTNIMLLFAAYIYENGGYATIEDGSTVSIVTGDDASYADNLKTALKASEYNKILADGSKTAQQLVAGTSSDLYVVDVDAGDVKAGSTNIGKFIVDNTVKTYTAVINKNVAFLKNCGILKNTNIASEINKTVTNAVSRMDSVSGALAIGIEAHKNNEDAIVAYLGRTDAKCELDSIAKDIINTSLFTSAMFTNNTVYVDLQDGSDATVVAQLQKHLKTVSVEDRDYTDNLKSIPAKQLNQITDKVEKVNNVVETVTNNILDALDKLPVTKKLIQDGVEQVKQNVLDNILNLFKK